MKPRVSIVIPCFNDGRYLRETVASARAQTYPDTEIILVDDHSTDSFTRDVIEALRANGVQTLSTPTGKKGLPSARNTGIAVASGKYILPLDADDIIDPRYVEKGVAALEARPEVGICYCKASLFGLKRGPWKLPPYSWEELLIDNMIFATALFRKSDWELVGGYDESLVRGFEDHAFWLHLIALGRDVVQLEEELFSYRVKSNSMVASMAAEERSMLAAEDVFRSCDLIFRDNARILFLTTQQMKKAYSKRACLFSWKLVQPLFRLEWAVRQLVKKALGRI